MGTISEKLTYLNETKGKIKDSINLTGAGITDQDTFRSYETKLKDGFVDIINNGVDTLYENFPKVSQTGEEPTLNGVYEAPMKVDLNGNTEQTTYTGKNLFNYNIIDVSTITIDTDGTLLISGINTANGYCHTQKTLSQLCPNLQVGDTAYLYLDTDFYENGNLKSYIYVGENWGNGKSKEITQTMLDAYIIVYGGYQTTSHLKIMVTKTLDTSYEPFVGGSPSPSPDFPQPIRVVTGDNTINVHGKNLFDEETFITKNNVSCSETGIISSTGISSNVWNYENGNFYVTLPTGNWNFTLFFDIKESNINSGIRGFDENGNRIVNKMDLSNQDSISIPITLNQTTTLGIMFKLDSGKLKLQIEKGSTATEYQPYQEQTYPLDLDDIELCKIGDYKDEIRKSTGKNIITTYNYASSGYINYNYDNSKIGKTMTYSFIPNFSTTNATLYIRANTSISSYNVGTISTITSGTKVSVTFTLTDEQYNTIKNTTGGYIQVYKSEVSMDENSISNPMLEKNNQATDYEPYGKVWYLKKNIGKVVLDGTLTQDTYSNNCYQTNIKYPSDIGNREVGAYCDYFKFAYYPSSLTSNIKNGEFAWNGSFYLTIKNTNLIGTVAYRNWLAQTKPTIYYILATPTYEEITATTLIEQLEDLKTAKSVEGQTNITQTNEELPFIINASALSKI